MKIKTPDIYDAQHPYRQFAIRIIEEAFEPWLEKWRGDDSYKIEGKEYYELEDKITDLLLKSKQIRINKNIK